MSDYPVKQPDVEANLDYGRPKPNYGGGYDPNPGPEPTPPEPEHGLIPKEYRPLVWTSMVTFLMAFLADFAARAAYSTYLGYVNNNWTAPTCWNFKLLFYCNVIMGVVYGLVSLVMLTPCLDRLFYSLYWDKNTFPKVNTSGRAFIRQMAILLFAVSLSQVIAPSNTGVGIVVLCISVMIAWNFVLLSCFDYYSDVNYFNIFGVAVRLADFYFVASIVFTALFSVALERTNVFYLPWKDDSQNQQTWLFYLNMVCGISYMIVGIISFLPIYDTWFLSFYFTDLPKARSSISFFTRNSACIVIGMAAASLIAPSNPGVGIVVFFAHLFLIPFFLMGICGAHGEIKNKLLWVGWLLSACLFAALYGYALSRLDECDADNVNCGYVDEENNWAAPKFYKDWTEQPWDTHKTVIDANSTWTGCSN